MPYGTPTESGAREYQALVTSVDVVDENNYRVQFHCVASTDNLNDEDVAPIFQKFVDLVSSSEDFTLTSATRTKRFSEPVTPTT